MKTHLDMINRSKQPSIKAGGFTLIELLTSVAIAGVLAAIAAPSFSTFMTKTRINSIANDMMGSINYAHIQALSLQQSVQLLPKTSSATDWNGGWQVKTVPPSGTSVLLRTYTAVKSGYSLSVGRTSLVFNSQGLITPTTLTFPLTVTITGGGVTKKINIERTGTSWLTD